MLALLQMARAGNIVIAIVTLAAGYFLSKGSFNPFSFIADACAFAFAIAFGNIYNDLLDVEADKINQPNRPIPSGKVTPFMAKGASLVCIGITLALAAIPSTQHLVHLGFFAAVILLLFLYDRFLKQIPLVKNVTVALLCATPIIRAMLLPHATFEPLYATAGFAFLFTLAREILKDLEDAEGDLKSGIATFPLIAGNKEAETLASLVIGFGILSIPMPVLLHWFHPAFLLLLVPMVPICIWIIRNAFKKQYRAAQKTTKMAMIVGLVALVLHGLF
ncbi:MAG: geranylgeranylglycerol-phosphate geranylgeranyltransferase [Fibrobacter sp.]|nr:geranylgeranylglycerol-phosphate geranylgeranyltransferase [Fibrobacter sp.]